MSQQLPSIRGFFRLDELLTAEELEQYSKGPIGLMFLNLGFEEIWHDPRLPKLCDAVAESLWGRRECSSACAIHANPPTTTSPVQGVCAAGVRKTLAAVTVQGAPIGYVSGPPHPSAKIYERDLQSLPPRAQEWLETHRLRPATETEKENGAIAEVVGYTARRLSRRCALERRLRVLRDARARFVAARDPDEVLDYTCKALEALFGDVDICFYVLDENGFLKLITARGPSGDATPASLMPEVGHVGRVIRERKSLYQPDLDGDPEFVHASLSNRARSSFTVLLPWGPDEFPGAIQAASRSPDHFLLYDRQAMQAVVEMAGLAAVKLFLKKKVAALKPNAAAETWASIGLAVTATETDRPVEILEAKSKLYQALVDEALRISNARAAWVAIQNVSDRTIRAAATAGDGWTEEAKAKFAHSGHPKQAVEYALDYGTEFYVPDTAKERRFKAILPFTRSLYLVPFDLKSGTTGVLSLSRSVRNGFHKEGRDEVKNLLAQFKDVLVALEAREDALFKRLSTDMNLKALVGEAIQIIRRAFHVRSCSLFLKDHDADRIELFATTEPMPENVHVYDFGEGLAGWVAKTRRTLRLRDTRDELELDAVSAGLRPRTNKAWRESIASGDMNRAYLAVPLIGRDRLVGVMRLKVKEDLSEFTHEEETAVLSVAGRLANAIDDVWIAEEAAAKVRQLENEAEFQRQLTEADSLQETCQVLSEEFKRSTGAIAAAIVIVDDTPGYGHRVWAASGLLKGLSFDNARMADVVLGISPQRTEPQFDDHVGERPQWRAITAPLEERFRGSPLATVVSAATLPFFLDEAEKVFGVLLLCWNMRQNFDDRSSQHFEDLTSRAVAALRPSAVRSHTDVDLKRRVVELSRIRAIGLGFAQNHDLDMLMKDILEVSLEESKMERGSIRLLNENASTLDLKFAIPGELAVQAVEVSPLFRNSLDSERCVFVKDVLAAPLWQAYRESAAEQPPDLYLVNVRSSLHVPIRLSSKCIGLILLDSSQSRDIETRVLEFLEILGLYAAVAIDFARMRKELSETIVLAEPLAMLGSMLQGFLHVVRNRINDLFAILGNLADASVTAQMRLQTNDMREQISGLHRVCNDLAQFARMDPVSVSERVTLHDLIERSMGDFRTHLRDLKITALTNFVQPSPVLLGNPIQIEIAVKMLVQNALEAMQQGGTLAVETTRDASGVRVGFRDTGVGMDEATITRCMQPFFTTKVDSGGTGLGLSVVYGIMKRHNGRLEIKSEPGMGSTFTLFFPMQEDRDVESADR